MSIICKPLTDVSFEEIYQCFTVAFSDYQLDLSYMNLEAFHNRAIKNAYEAGSSKTLDHLKPSARFPRATYLLGSQTGLPRVPSQRSVPLGLGGIALRQTQMPKTANSRLPA